MRNEYFRMMCAAAGAAAAIIGSATGAMAQPQGPSTTIFGQRAVEGFRVSVPHRDLNLTNARDERALHYRVKGAARSVCAPNDDQLVYRPFSKCVRSAMDGAQPQIDLAVRRAREIAATGTSNIPLVAIAVVGARVTP